MKEIFFNAHHSPMGAFASFTLGYKGAKGGLGLELTRPADQNVFIGLESNRKNIFEALPFSESTADEKARYDVEKNSSERGRKVKVIPFEQEKIRRDFKAASDTWSAGDLTFKIYSPFKSIPDPDSAKSADVKEAVIPAVFVEITVDNSKGKIPRRAYFGYQGTDPYYGMRRIDDTTGGKIKGVGQGSLTAIATAEKDAYSALAFSIEEVISPDFMENIGFSIGQVGALVFTVPAGVKKTCKVAVCFYRGGVATTGMKTSYLYTRYFKNIEDVADFALGNFSRYRKTADLADAVVGKSGLSADQKFMMSHAVRSYYGSTELLQSGNKAVWVVNEGEYRMLNTFDLTVDQVFFEMKMNPWTVKNVLDLYVSRYSYFDKVHYHGDAKLHPGGISFTHDMGNNNVFSRPQYSCYEKHGLDGCFSHMTHEQLVNWILCGAVYYDGTKDGKWLKKNMGIFEKCLASLMNRDNPDPEKRDGVMALDSSRTMQGAEITTYDSLDVSLGQSRNNLYLAVKSWASYVALERIFASAGRKKLANIAARQAGLCARTIASKQTAKGYIPAVFEKGNDSKIIPGIEGLAFPLFTGCPEALRENGKYSDLIKALKQHIHTVLVPGTCLCDDGGWKISSTSNNTWLSKNYLCQFVYREILGFKWGSAGAKADAAHIRWLVNSESGYWAWSDQIISGIAKGSKYYPRGVTSILWLEE
ncbi:MAG TPA: beta-xylosidase [Lentisphaeria bacterium]|nr:MAG: beta-xylosidase [Lentisphaerae bacterium GWF2_50_93]HCE46261.1 beta-xylosidase [Lentisphaeria bacterium]